MEGYSVTEAASVLGVPTERVWELLARGVLAGAPEGETGMRVFLQPRPAPAPAEPSTGGGNGGGEPQRELSPFRELLTEFRNLTERYGQALLALGEARGEVAALRSRVDLLEARMDLRLPAAESTGPPIGWAQPMPSPASRPQPPPPSTHEPVGESRDAEADAEPRHLRRDSPRRATESFAEALARAEDPSMPELPVGPDTTLPLSSLRIRMPHEEEAAPEAGLPRELPPAEDVPVADEAAVTVDEPRPDEAVPPSDVAPAVDEPAAEPTVEAEEPVLEADVEPEGEDPAEAAAAPRDQDEAEAPERPAWQDERYTAEIGEPDWWEAEALPQPAAAEPGVERTEAGEAEADVESPAPEAAAVEPEERFTADMTEPVEEADQETGTSASVEPALEPEPVPLPGPSAEPAAEPTFETPPERPAASAPVEQAALTRLRRLTPSRTEEETVLWLGRSPDVAEAAEARTGGAEEMEIAPSGGATSPAEGSSAEPDRTLDDAVAALEALSRAGPPRATPEAPEAQSRPQDADARSAGAPERPPIRPVPPTPAGRAYRRLRRIFPG